jgi:hypothetical protein
LFIYSLSKNKTFSKGDIMASRQTTKNRINKILTATTKGRFNDEYWLPVQAAWKALHDAGYQVQINSSEYQWENGKPKDKQWKFEIPAEKGKPFYGVLTCHGAGTVEDPLSVYDISAYVS